MGTIEQKTAQVFHAAPDYVVRSFGEELFSGKMGPLLFDQFASEKGAVRKYEVALLLIIQRPRGWREQIEGYITSLPTDSYFLYCVLLALQSEYQYSFVSSSGLAELSHLIKMTHAKHVLGIRKPGLQDINKYSFKLLPKRDTSED